MTLALLVAKIGLHWRWIVSMARRRIFPAPAPSGRRARRQPAPVAAQMGRRDFVRLMAGVGAVALLAGANALSGHGDDQAEAALCGTEATGSTHGPGRNIVGEHRPAHARCAAARRCSYPGHCRKYTDSNNNGRCDLGECLS